MSASPVDVARPATTGETTQRETLSRPAWVCFWLVLAAAAAATAPFLAKLELQTNGWATFAVLAAGAAAAEFFVVETPANQSYNAAGVFLIAAALLLPLELVALVAVVQHVPDWLNRRRPLPIQVFNIANFTLATMAAWGAAHGILALDFLNTRGAGGLLAGAAACVLFVGLNHLLLAPMLRFARSLSFRDSGLFTYSNLSTDLALAGVGVALATLWSYNVWLVPFALVTLVLVHRSLSVPALQAEARIDSKTGLFNARHFAETLREELHRAVRFERPMAVIMADLDLLRDINNAYGHLAGDAVLTGVARIFREELREYDVPARFGGEEFAVLLPETTPEEAFEIAERIRRAVSEAQFVVETLSEPIMATVSFGVAGYPRDGVEANDIVHQADLAVYRAKLQGRNRVLDASNDPLLAQPGPRAPVLAVLPGYDPAPVYALPPVPELVPEPERRKGSTPRAPAGPYFVWVPRRLAVLVGVIGVAGVGMGAVALLLGSSTDIVGFIAIIALVAIGQALSLEFGQTGTISVSAVGALAGAAIIGPRAALVLAITISVVEWSTHRGMFHQVLFNVGALTLASLAAAQVFSLHLGGTATAVMILTGIVAGLWYFVVNTGLLSIAVALETHETPWHVWRERFRWLLAHYAVYGLIAGVIFEAYRLVGVWALIVFVLPLLIMRSTQDAYLRHTERSAGKLRQAAETIQTQNVSLEQANRQLKERSTAAMASLSATVDARDTYTAGHSRRVQEISLAIGSKLELSEPELELLGYAALFHDIGKLGIPDSILLKPSSLTNEEWALMKLHAGDGASIIQRLGFLDDAVPAICHHHERYDGRGYPDGLAGEQIPLGARIIHVADALDSMLSARVYRPARQREAALAELRAGAGTQFCPRSVAALEALMSDDETRWVPPQPELLASVAS